MTQRLRSVAIVGIDGSGKSTQADILRRSLAGRGSDVVTIHPFGWKLLAPFVPPSAVGGTGAAGPASSGAASPASASPRSPRLIAVAELADIAAYLGFAYARAWLTALVRRRTVWLVSDRAAADVLVKQRRRGTLREATVQRWHRLVPRPQLTIWLSTRPATAAERDGEFALAYYEELHARYAEASAQLGWQTIDTSARTVEEVSEQVAAMVGRRWSRPSQDRGAAPDRGDLRPEEG